MLSRKFESTTLVHLLALNVRLMLILQSVHSQSFCKIGYFSGSCLLRCQLFQASSDFFVAEIATGAVGGVVVLPACAAVLAIALEGRPCDCHFLELTKSNSYQEQF